MSKFPKELIQFETVDTLPIHLQIYNRFKQAVEQNLLNDGDRVPSTRTLASELNVARGTVESAYSMLLGEGVFISKGQAGTFISKLGALNTFSKHTITIAHQSPKKVVTDLGSIKPTTVSPVFLPGSPAFDAFPRKLWSRLSGNSIRRLSMDEMRLKDPEGYGPLRQSISTYLRISRGVVCEPEQVFITNGYQGAVDFLAKVLRVSGQDVWVEDPGYYFSTIVLKDMGANIIGVPVDEDGMIVEEGVKKSPNAKLAVVTPSHHSPLGMALSAERRMKLLKWATKNDSWIIEDDYDGEFRYSGYPLPSLKSLDQYDRVIYAGSFSKTLYPGIKVGYIVVPNRLVDLCSDKAHIYQRGFSVCNQMTINDFITEGHFSKHLKKMRDLYAHRREVAAEILKQILGDNVTISSHKNGMHFVAKIDEKKSDVDICKSFNSLGYGIFPLSKTSINTNYNGLIIGFTNIMNKKSAEDAALKLMPFITCD